MSALLPIATAKADSRKRSCPLYPRKRTCAVQPGMSAKGQKRTLCRAEFVTTGSLLALIHYCDDRPIAAMAGRIIAAEIRRIETRRHASVEKEGIPAAEAVAEKTGKLVKVHPAFGDDEMHLGRARHADSVPPFTIG